MRDKVVSEDDPFILEHSPDKYMTHEMCDKAVNAFLSALKFVLDWFVTKKMIEILSDDLFSKADIVFVNEGSNYVTFFNNEMGIPSVNVTNINLDDI